MSYVQQITLRNLIRQDLTPECNHRLDELGGLSFFPQLPDQDNAEAIGAELSLLYLEFHKQFELCEIIRNNATKVAYTEFEIDPASLYNIIGEWRAEIDKMKDKDKISEALRIERKLSDIFQLSELNDHFWQIVYTHEGAEIYES